MPSGPERLNWAPGAERDIREIWSYHATEASRDTANKIFETIMAAVMRIVAHPLAGRPREGLRPGLRSILAHPYVIFYRLQDDTVQIARILHERRNFDAALSKRD
jgi:toxin ParE1/3/4